MKVLTKDQRIKLALGQIDRAVRMMDRPHSPSGESIREAVSELRELLNSPADESWKERLKCTSSL